MRCKKLVGHLLCSAAIGAIAMAPLAATAQDTTTGTTGTGSMGMGSGAMMSTEPVAVSGTIVRYYTDRSGYVTAADVQTASGIQMVHFSPGMGQRLYTSSPVGGQVNVWVTPNAMGTGHWDVVGMGTDRPAGGFMSAYNTTAVDLLESEPYIMAGAQLMTVRGTLRGVVTANNGEVLALVLDNAEMGSAAMGKAQMTNTSMPAAATDASATTAGGTGTDSGGASSMTSGSMGGTMSHGIMMNSLGGSILVRVPREVRHIAPGAMGTGRVTPLFKGSDVTAKGYIEATRYGALSTFSNRLVANALVVNGRSVGALGVPMMPRGKNKPLFGGLDVPLLGGSASPEETRAMEMGYTTYSTDGSMGGSSTAPGSTPGTTGTTPQ